MKTVKVTIIINRLYQGLIAAVILTAGTATAFAQGNENWTYVVKPGDTLSDISQQYMNDVGAWQGLAREANVNDPRHLQPGQVLSIPIDQLRHENRQLHVAFVRGQASVSSGTQAAQPLTRDAALTEGQVIETGPDGFVSLALPDGSRVLISANSRLKIGQFRYVPDADKVLVEFSLEKGYVESEVTPQADNSRFRVRTPLAVTGVRGTRFGVSISANGRDQTNDVSNGTVAIIPTMRRAGDEVLVNAGQGARLLADSAVPNVQNLLPAPELEPWPQYIHEASSWTPVVVANAAYSGYLVQVAPENKPDQVMFESRGELEPIGALDDDRYRISVRAIDGNGILGASASRVVTVKTEPIAPLTQSPAQNQPTRLATQHLTCTNVLGAQGYVVQVARDRQFRDVVFQQSGSQCQFTFEPKEEGVYYWRAASLDQLSGNVEDHRGAFGQVSIIALIKGPASPLSDTVRTDSGTQGIVLYWDSVPASSAYRVQVSDKQDFSNLLLSKETSATQMPLGFAYSCKALYVRIQSISDAGIESDFSQPRILQTAQTWCTNDGVTIVDGHGAPVGIDAR